MATDLTQAQSANLQLQLRQRIRAIRDDLRIELEQSDNAQTIALAGRVRDLGDDSVADLLRDVNLAAIDLHIRQLWEIDAARQRMDQGRYGICIDCGEAIGYARLHAYPAAARCRDCQERFEITQLGSGASAL